MNETSPVRMYSRLINLLQAATTKTEHVMFVPQIIKQTPEDFKRKFPLQDASIVIYELPEKTKPLLRGFWCAEDQKFFILFRDSAVYESYDLCD